MEVELSNIVINIQLTSYPKGHLVPATDDCYFGISIGKELKNILKVVL